MDVSQMKRMAVDAMVKYVNDDEIYDLAKALEEAAEQVEALQQAVHDLSNPVAA